MYYSCTEVATDTERWDAPLRARTAAGGFRRCGVDSTRLLRVSEPDHVLIMNSTDLGKRYYAAGTHLQVDNSINSELITSPITNEILFVWHHRLMVAQALTDKMAQ
jgi:hypothetical protein